LTSIGNSPAQADAIYRRAVQVLDAETQAQEMSHPAMPLAWCL
jgi:hypothetical protein